MADVIAGNVTATFNYLRDPPTDDPTIAMVYDPIRGVEATMRLTPVQVEVFDGRQEQEGFSLDREGFRLVSHHSRITDFLDRSQTDNIYPREAAALIREVSGAFAAVGTGANVRFGRKRIDYEVYSEHKPARFPHADFTDESAREFLDLHGPLSRDYSRWAIYNIWQVFSEPPQDFPLAVCDARTVSMADEDMVRIKLKVPGRELIQGMATVYYPNPSNRWFYFSNMTVDEALIFKAYDSDPVRPRRVPHSAFLNPLVGSEHPTRSSIETRIVAFFR